MKKAINCPDHKDNHASAAIFTRPDGSEWLHCLGCKTSRLYKEANDMKETDYSEDELMEKIELVGQDVKHCLDPIDLLETLSQDKGITPQMIEAYGGFVTDEGYLGFKYGKGREVYRNLMPENKKPRFINIGNNKGLMGDNDLHCDEIFLVEGLTDWISFKYFINTNVVTSFGAELSEDQAYLLRNKTVFILFDRDFAGFKGAKQAALRLKEYEATPIILELPNLLYLEKKIDINYLIHKGKKSFEQWLDKAISKYSQFDTNYLEEVKEEKELKYYHVGIPELLITEGFYVISGDPGVGKTTTCVSMIDNFVAQGGKVLYCNYDLPKRQIIARLASRYIEKHTWKEIEQCPWIISDYPKEEELIKQCLKNIKVVNNLTIEELNYCYRFYTHIIVDYLQRVPNFNTDKLAGFEYILNSLSNMGSNEGKTIIGVSKQSFNGNPFSGSSLIPYHAQATLLLSSPGDGIISCQIDKNTRGEKGTFLYKVNYPHQRLYPTKLNSIAEEKLKGLFNQE